mgnify:CR=1 FL=1
MPLASGFRHKRSKPRHSFNKDLWEVNGSANHEVIMFKKAFVAALMTATALTPAFADGEDDTTETEIASEVTLSHVNGEALQIVCNYEVCKVHSLQPGADVWDREEVQPADVGVFETLVVKYAALGYT